MKVLDIYYEAKGQRKMVVTEVPAPTSNTIHRGSKLVIAKAGNPEAKPIETEILGVEPMGRGLDTKQYVRLGLKIDKSVDVKIKDNVNIK